MLPPAPVPPASLLLLTGFEPPQLAKIIKTNTQPNDENGDFEPMATLLSVVAPRRRI
jgi:hypothetical protein